MVRINAEVSDDEKALFDEVVAESDATSQKEWILQHIHEDADELGVKMEDALTDEGSGEESGITEMYDSDDYSGTLDSEQLRELVTDDPEVEINPEHVGYAKAATPQGYRTEVVAAMARYEHTAVSRSDVVRLCESIGLDSRYFVGERANDKDIPGAVVERFGGDDEGAAVDANAIEEQAVGAAMIVDNGATVKDYKTLASTWETARDDADLSDGAQEVVSAAIEKLSKVSAVRSARVSNEVDEWPESAGGLVDKFAADAGVGDLERGKVADEIADVAGVPAAMIPTDDGPKTVGVWIEATRGAIDGDLPADVLEARVQKAEEALDDNPDHPRTDEVRAALDELHEAIEERREEAEA